MKRRQVCAVFLAFAALLCLASAALAATITDRPLLKTCDGTGKTAGAFGAVRNLEVEQSSGDLYVFDAGRKVLDKFNAGCEPQDFATTSESSLVVSTKEEAGSGYADVALDNSGGLTNGDIYVTSPFLGGTLPVLPFDNAGIRRPWELTSPKDFHFGCASAVDAEGHLWLSDKGSSPMRALEFDSGGNPLPDSFPYMNTNNAAAPCSLDFDAAGNAYVAFAIDGYSSKGVDKYVKNGEGKYEYSSTLDPEPSAGVAVDRASGHVFVSHRESFSEYDSGGALIGSFGKGVISEGIGIAVNETLGDVYVANYSGPKVYVFGPVATGTVPNATIEPASEEEVSGVTLNGMINPNSVPNAYFFEWKRGIQPYGWGLAKSSEKHSIEPTDSEDHEVSFNVTGLAGNTTYQARLVGLNTENKLRQVSAPITFTTKTAPGPPVVTIDPVEAELTPPCTTGITTDGACVSGGVNPREDFSTSWWLETSTDRKCETGFTKGPVHSEGAGSPEEVEEWESNSPIEVHEELTGLLPSQHYCVLLKAENSFNPGHPATSAVKEFETEPIPPDQVVTAFAAPRTATSARLNAYANPEGETMTYRFEYSEDGGKTWIVLKDHEDKSEARHPILLSSTTAAGEQLVEELTELSPATTYSYRFVAESAAEPDPEGEPGVTAVVKGEAKAFTTRSKAEVEELEPPSCQNEAVRANRRFAYLPECRGVELVNNPEDGNQNVEAGIKQETAPFSPDGGRAIWNVNGGAPGANSGAGASFLAKRTGQSAATPTGWQSCSLAPPAAEQIHGEDGSYILMATTPELRRFLFLPGVSESSRFTETLVRLGECGQGQEVLWSYDGPQSTSDAGSELSSNGAHVLRLESPGGGSATVTATEGSNKVKVEKNAASEYIRSGAFIPGRPVIASPEGYFPSGTKAVKCIPSCAEPEELELSGPAEKSGAEVRLETFPQLEDIGTPGKPEVLGYLPGETLPECGLDNEGVSFIGGGGRGAGLQWRPGYRLAAATDASRVYFQVYPNGECGGISGPWQLLERDREIEETLVVAPPGAGSALIRATPDGRSVYFVTVGNCRKPRQVSPYGCDAEETADTNERFDVYRWDEETEADTCLTCDMENEAGKTITGANLRVIGNGAAPVMVSDDSSHLYFESGSKLTPQASPGKGNLYALSGGQLRFVATPNSSPFGVLGRGQGSGKAELSSNGNVLVFETTEAGNHELSADRLAASCTRPSGGSGSCQELFRYDYRDQSLECLSCLDGGTTTASVGAKAGNDFRVSADGETVAFVTSQALTPRDVNNGPDLYEWRNGAQRLITNGAGDFGQGGTAALQPYALSAEGRDILFKATDPGLTDFEQNRLANLYDARVGGGFEPPPPPKHCWEGSEESCQGPLRPEPPFDQPGSATIVGRGNEHPPKPSCPKGRARRHGRCVAKKHKHRKRAHRRGANNHRRGVK